MAAYRADTGVRALPSVAGRAREFAEAHANAVLRAVLDVVVTIDHRGGVLEFNRAAEELFGYRRDDVLGRELAGLILPRTDRRSHEALVGGIPGGCRRRRARPAGRGDRAER